MARWDKRDLRLADDHGWRCKPGYRIFVADRGAVRFDIPQSWVCLPDSESIKLHDREPPDDECVVEVTVNYLRPADYSEFPLESTLAEVLADGYETATYRGPVESERRGDTRLAWAEIHYTDTSVMRAAVAKTLIGLRRTIQFLLTMAYWKDDVAQFEPVWDEILRSVQMGEQVDILGNPTRVVH